ncbi:DUF6389 family protein [Streptomyces sp. AC495_CC817]|uniref:DUF6389 family protein n=1 Tax=Streptomyces sp. AC495_CC817 TaxID=2823900 RepID=UPI001C27FC8C|nr:DUF6389 family protein [Streptomyces sp. AC495_CC817]
MNSEEHVAAVISILDASSSEVASRLGRFFAAAREEGSAIEGILIDVFVDQDGEGPFDVWARFDGAGAFPLDRRFDEERRLFGVTWGARGWTPPVPGRPRGWSREDLEDAVVDAVGRWLEPLLPPGSPEGFWLIGSPDGGCA